MFFHMTRDQIKTARADERSERIERRVLNQEEKIMRVTLEGNFPN